MGWTRTYKHAHEETQDVRRALRGGTRPFDRTPASAFPVKRRSASVRLAGRIGIPEYHRLNRPRAALNASLVVIPSKTVRVWAATVGRGHRLGDERDGDRRRETRPRSAPSTTYFEERGGVHDAPIETVGDFMQEGEDSHPRALRDTLPNIEAMGHRARDRFASRHSATPRRWLLELSRLRPQMAAHSAHRMPASRAAGKREETSRPSRATRTDSLKSILEVCLSPSRVRALARVWRAGHQMNLEKVWADAARGRSGGHGGRSGGETVTGRGTREKCGCRGS